MRALFTTLALSLSLGLTACGGEGSEGGDTVDRTCGNETCTAGQYCRDESLSICENGCLSNDDCASDQTCDLSDRSPGTCINDNGNGEEGPDNLEVCLDECDDLGFFCEEEGGTDAEVQACTRACNDGSPSERLQIAECMDLPGDCTIALACY